VSLAWHPSGKYLAVGVSETVTQTTLFVYSVSNTGVITTPAFASATVTPFRETSREALGWDQTGTYLGIGVATDGVDPELLIYTFSPNTASLTLTSSMFLGETVTALDWNLTFTNIIAVGLFASSTTVIAYNHNAATGLLTQNATITNIGTAARAMNWNPVGGGCLAVGSAITSTGGGMRVYAYNNSAGTFAQTVEQEQGNVGMTTRWNRTGTDLSVGGTTNLLSIYGAVGGLAYTFSNLEVRLNSSVSLYNSLLVFSGACTLDGQGNVFDLTDTSTIVLASGSSLLCKNVIIKGLHDSNFYAVDKTGIFYLDQVQLWLDGYYTFSHGALVIEFGDTIISGTSIFYYRSEITSTIATESSLIIDQNVTFSYAPSNNQQSLIAFQDSLSQLILQRSSLFVGSQGMNLLKGMVTIIGQSYICGDGTTPGTGIMFGDNITSSNNCVLSIAGGRLDIVRGFVRYQNI
jgi:hypothetical protein